MSKTEGITRKTFRTIDCETTIEEDYDFEADLEQLIANSRSLIAEYDSVDSDEFIVMVLKLLHCHILPLIALHVEDIPLLEQLEEQQKELIKHAEKDMQHKSLNLDEVQRRIYKQCDKFIDELRRSDEITYPTNFAKILFQDVHVYLKIVQEDLNMSQCEVDKLKMQPVENAAGLEEKRKIRNRAHAKYQTILEAREHLTGLMDEMQHSRCHQKERKGDMAKHWYNIYIALHQERSKLINEMQQILEKKLLQLSVLEATRWTIEDIKIKKMSFGLDIDASGRKSTDVLCHSLIPVDWKSIGEKVCSVVMDTKTDIGKAHTQMIKNIIDKCIQVHNIVDFYYILYKISTHVYKLVS